MIVENYLNKLNVRIKTSNQNFIQIHCPICNEGNSSFKARGYIMINSGEPFYNCFNCEDGGKSFYKFLNEQNPYLAKEYYKETRLRNRNVETQSYDDIKKLFDAKIDFKEMLKEEVYNPLDLEYKEFNNSYYTYTANGEQITVEKDLSDLTTEAKEYLLGRGLTEDDIKDYKFCTERNDIVVPFFLDKSKNLVYGMQMRNLYEKRFHNQFFGTNPKISNLEHITKLPEGTDIYVMESEFDRISTTLKNSVAVLGAKMSQDVLKMLYGFNFIFLGDADNTGVKKSLEYAELGWQVLVHELDMFEFKDFNKCLELGLTKEDITTYILNNIKGSMRARIELRKIYIKED